MSSSLLLCEGGAGPILVDIGELVFKLVFHFLAPARGGLVRMRVVDRQIITS